MNAQIKKSQRRRLLLVALCIGFGAVVSSAAVAIGWNASYLSGQSAGKQQGIPVIKSGIIGLPSAQEEIVIFHDFLCDHCVAFFQRAEEEIIRRYVLNGDVRLRVRSVPFLGPESETVAEASFCAGDQGLYWEFYSAVQESYAQSGRAAYSNASLKTTASLIGADADKLLGCVANGSHRIDVQENLRVSRERGINGVPATVIGEKVVMGNRPFADYQIAIDEVLRK